VQQLWKPPRDLSIAVEKDDLQHCHRVVTGAVLVCQHCDRDPV
jgi:hypothetical protein